MAIVHVGSLGATNTGTAGTTLSVAISANAEVGNLVVVSFKMPNVSTVSGNSNDVISCTDASSNTWTKAGEYTQTPGGVPSDGSTTAVYWTRVTTQINSGANITITTPSLGNKAMMVDEFTVGGALTQYGTTQTTGSSGTTNPGSLTVGSLSSNAYLAYRGVGMDGANNINSGSAGWTQLSGASSASRAVDAEMIISTSTTYTSAPTLSGAPDSASVMFVLGDFAAPSTSINTLFMGML
jgi:hypothetical protein